MEARHVVLQLVGVTGAAAAIWAAVAEARRERSTNRLPLVNSLLSIPQLLIVFGSIGLLLPVLWLIFSQQLVPKGRPLVFMVTLAWIGLGFVALLIKMLGRHLRKNAEGWVTMLDGARLRVEYAGTDTTLTLRPGAVRLYFTPGVPSGVLFEFVDGERVVHFQGQVAIPDMKLVTPGTMVQPRGPIFAASTRGLCAWLEPYLVRH